MSKTTKIIAALGVVAGLGVAALPISSFAATSPQSAEVEVQVTISSDISLTLDANSVSTSMDVNETDETMQTTATVSTNDTDGYTLTIADKDTNTSLVSGTNSIPANAAFAAGTAGWAIKGGLINNYTAMPASDGTALVAAEATAAVANDATVMTYGVGTAANQATGTYTDTIVYTATVK